ncbi:protein farnesyltransferase beta subunit [Cavenderia fasciculata]|uniref:Protein farnesyltransferase subunit beta n=1 Tax=Cavenderia fasciculata TaxID=261658 RepID=F4QA53_CACFS|nr:protein farnesyltransferase beta subunit [Cavenderia fasciculata]EGG15572.1 protein farnesyltransferase beta subunit [Cavenderia fasciculata]|eukprot:XP_004354314.1 protein farnesyltransferase beta subunit [Cavenderia fasciculata]
MSRIQEIDIDTDEDYNSNIQQQQNNINNVVQREPITPTVIAQNGMIAQIMEKRADHKDDETGEELEPGLFKEQCVSFATDALGYIHGSHTSLESSRAWICFWNLHALDLLGYLTPERLHEPTKTTQSKVVEGETCDGSIKSRSTGFLKRLQQPSGGFAGGMDQVSHMVSTFAAVSALMVVESYEVINRRTMYQFLMRMKTAQGSFKTQEDGEDDSRSTYCAMVVATLLNIVTPELIQGVPEYLARCQTYEGGFGGQPGVEAHGGYTFCSVAALSLLNSLHLINFNSLLRWLVNRQLDYDGGIQGRTNKLVDTCYSYWQCALFPILRAYDESLASQHHAMFYQNIGNSVDGKQLFNQQKLQEYCLVCCQNVRGGFSDHPQRGRDYYHTCYTLAGLSVSQHNDLYLSVNCINGSRQEMPPVTLTSDVTAPPYTLSDCTDQEKLSNLIEPTHPIFNLCLPKCGNGQVPFILEDVDSKYTIGRVKRTLCARYNIPVKSQRLILGGRQLKNRFVSISLTPLSVSVSQTFKTLEEYKIDGEFPLHLVLRLSLFAVAPVSNPNVRVAGEQPPSTTATLPTLEQEEAGIVEVDDEDD